MASGWDAEMQERFERLEQKVDHLGDKVERLEGQVETLGVKVDANTEKIDALTKNIDANTEKIDANTERLDRFERTFASKIEIENLRDLVQRSAEGFGATLDRIERGIAEIRGDWQQKWEDHDRVLRDHARRITALESE
jgi:chromosome segregation ATPase